MKRHWSLLPLSLSIGISLAQNVAADAFLPNQMVTQYANFMTPPPQPIWTGGVAPSYATPFIGVQIPVAAGPQAATLDTPATGTIPLTSIAGFATLELDSLQAGVTLGGQTSAGAVAARVPVAVSYNLPQDVWVTIVTTNPSVTIASGNDASASLQVPTQISTHTDTFGAFNVPEPSTCLLLFIGCVLLYVGSHLQRAAAGRPVSHGFATGHSAFAAATRH